MFERYAVRCEYKNRHQKAMCLKEIGLRAYKLVTILDSVVNIIGTTYYDHLLRMRIFTLIMNKIFIRAPKIMRQIASGVT